jgi:hypothetical protein
MAGAIKHDAKYECLGDIHDLSTGYVEFYCERVPESSELALFGSGGYRIREHHYKSPNIIKEIELYAINTPQIEWFNFSVDAPDIHDDLSIDERKVVLDMMKDDILKNIRNIFSEGMLW